LATEKIVLMGAGSAVFTRGLVADLIDRGWPAELALVDIDPDALAVAEGLTRKMLEARRSPVRLTASTDRREVLEGATAVICTVAVGGRRAWEHDVVIPRRYDIHQPVGDTVLPGGTSRALRMIPAMVAIAEDVLDLAPGALLFNYSNPMTAICRAVRKATGADMVGLCHGVFGVAGHLAEILGVPVEQLDYTAVGMNHLTWFTRVAHQGRDRMGELTGIARQLIEQLKSCADPLDRAAWKGTPLEMAAMNPFSWQLLELMGGIPSALDRHVIEFFPQMFRGPKSYYGKTPGADVFNIEATIQGGDEGFAQMRADALGPARLDEDYFRRIGGEHEQVLDILASLRADDGKVYSANLPNAGQVPNLPAEAVVESPAAADGGRLRPLPQDALPPAIAATLAGRFMWVETIVEAALECSRRKFIQALVVDGAVGSLQTAEALADDLLAAHAEHLPGFTGQ